jgi:hypothetical protein
MTTYGNDIPVTIPALTDTADIQVAFQQYHTGSTDGTTQAGSLSAAINAKAPLASPTFTGTVTLPNSTVTAAMIVDNTITSAKLATGTIVDEDINSSAAIAQSKISGLVSDLAGKASTTSVSDLSTSVTTSLTTLKNTIDYASSTSTSYTLALTDAGKMVGINNASAITVTIPLNSSVAFPINSRIDILQVGSGQISFSPTTGVTLNSKGTKRKMFGQYSAATLIKIGTDTWMLIGDITA